jgi:predicted DNA-binding transcriptional regulator AlpA
MQSDNPLAPHEPTRLSAGDLVDEREAAAILGCAVQTLRNWRWRKAGPKVRRVGPRMVRYLRADLAAYIAGEDQAA